MDVPASRDRVHFIEHAGVRILLTDYRGIDDSEELRREVEGAAVLLRQEPSGSALVLACLEGVPYTLENVGILKKAVIRNRPFVKARAVVGLPRIAFFSYSALARISDRPMASFRTVDEALEWLVERG